MHSQQLLLGISTREICVASHQQELEVLGIHCDKLHDFVSEPHTLGGTGDRPDLINTKQSEIDGRRLVLFKPLKENIVHMSIPLVCERTDDKVNASRQLSLHPNATHQLLTMTRIDVAGLHGNKPHWASLSLSQPFGIPLPLKAAI